MGVDLLLQFLPLIFFFLAWNGYSAYAKRRAKGGKMRSVSRTMHNLREQWMLGAAQREMRMHDAALLASQERVASFFASASMLILAATVTAISSPPNFDVLLSFIPFTEHQSEGAVRAKLVLIGFIFVYAFFKFTWAIRQYGFVSVMMGAMPDVPKGGAPVSEATLQFASHTAKVMDRAAIDNNHGLRAYYFALAVLCWLISDEAFMVATTLVVWVLYRRECHSPSILSLETSLTYLSLHNSAERLSASKRAETVPYE